MPHFHDEERWTDSTNLLVPDTHTLQNTPVFPLIAHLKEDIATNIDSALTWEQLTASDVNFSIVKPLVSKYSRLKHLSTVYACLVIKGHFLSLASDDLAHANLQFSRAVMAELMAIKLIRHFASNHIELVAVLTISWNPLWGASEDTKHAILAQLGVDEDDIDDPTSALEAAIATKSKRFLGTSIVQTVVNKMHNGTIVFTTPASRSVVADNYKMKAIEIYDCRTAPFLNHYRLRVPKYGSILECLNFILLLVTFMLSLSNRELHQINSFEQVFILFAFGFVLDEYTAAREHGWSIYMANMWNIFDLSFIVIFLTYFIMRCVGVQEDSDDWVSDAAFDILACGACILVPRLAFFALKNNVVILSLRGMITEFIFFMIIAAICFSGLLFTLWTLGNQRPDTERWTVGQIAWLMTQVWFGNSFLSFGQAESFHPIFGPILMTIFAALSNTLLLTILISILSNTFARIDANATQEHLYQYTIATIEGVKNDALFSYQPPLNILAYLILLPLSWVLSPRTLHSVNVFLIRLLSFPILVCISVYERYLASGQKVRSGGKEAAKALFNSLPRHIKGIPIVEAIMGGSSRNLYAAIFEADVSTAGMDLFEGIPLEIETPFALRSLPSRESMERQRTPSKQHHPGARSRSPPLSASHNGNQRDPPKRDPVSLSIPTSPRLGAAYSEGILAPSPLSRLFRVPRAAQSTDRLSSNDVASNLKRMEAVLESMQEVPLERIRDDMQRLQERQARIESLLLSLTRALRGDSDRLESSSLQRNSTH